MFGTETHQDDGMLFGAAFGVALRTRREREAHDEEIAQIEAIHAESIALHAAEIRRLQLELAAAQRELTETKRTLVAERCEIAGLNAFIDRIETLDARTPGLAPSGQFYRSGNAKVVATLDYERAYDAKAVELGFAALRGTYAK